MLKLQQLPAEIGRISTAPSLRRGKVIFWLLISLMVIISVTALSLDGGRMLSEHRDVQSAANSAALAAAGKLRTGQCGEPDFTGVAMAAALDIAAANGFSNDASSKVTVHIPPQSGEFAGKPRFAEVIIEIQLTGSFSRLLTQTPLVVKARAVAQSLRREVGLLVLKKSGQEVLFVNTSGTVDLQGAPVWVNSDDPVAYHITNSSKVIADSHSIQGKLKTSNGGKAIGPVKPNAIPQINPLLCLPKINIVNYLTQKLKQLVITAGSLTLDPGVYKGGIKILGNSNVILKPGVYIMDGGGFDYSGAGDLTAKGVTIVNTGPLFAGQINIKGNGKVTITAPESGVYAGISIFQPNLTETVTISGNGDTHIQGIAYVPKGHVDLNVLGTDLSTFMGGGYVTNTLEINGDGSFRIGAALENPSPAATRLVE